MAGIRRPADQRSADQQGFTLLEAIVAIGMLAIVITSFLGIRTRAVQDAVEARNWRLAKELAEAKLSEIRAGAHETELESGVEIRFDEYPHFTCRIFIGEAAVAEADSLGAGDPYDEAGDSFRDRLEWQQERDMVRQAQREGMTRYEYEDQLIAEDEPWNLKTPSETDVEPVAVAVTFPKADPTAEGEDVYILRANLSTLALSGMTAEDAQRQAEARGEATAAADNSTAPPGGGGK